MLMLISFTIWLILMGIPCASLLCVCSVLAIWLAMGRTHIFVRMPLFLFGTLPLGLVPCLAAANRHACHAYVFGALLIAASALRTHILLQLPLFVFGAAYLIAVPSQIPTNGLDSSWIARVTLAISFVACVLAPLRWRGFRFVKLLEGISGLELERGTGKDLDQWIAYLDAAGANELNHAEIMALLREYGLPFDRQKPVAVVYQRAVGRWSIGRSIDRRREVVDQRSVGLLDWLTRSTDQQFSIWQMMLATFCVASLMGFIRNFSWSAPTAVDVKYGIPVTLGVATTTLAATWACSTIANAQRKIRFAWLVAVLVPVVVPLLMGFRSVGSPIVLVIMATMFAHAALLIGLLSNARYRGYRLVCVQAKEPPLAKPATEPPPPSIHPQSVRTQP